MIDGVHWDSFVIHSGDQKMSEGMITKTAAYLTPVSAKFINDPSFRSIDWFKVILSQSGFR